MWYLMCIKTSQEKRNTRDLRARDNTSMRVSVRPDPQVYSNFRSFLRNDENKTEFFVYLPMYLSRVSVKVNLFAHRLKEPSQIPLHLICQFSNRVHRKKLTHVCLCMHMTYRDVDTRTYV